MTLEISPEVSYAGYPSVRSFTRFTMTHRLVLVLLISSLYGCADHSQYAGEETRALKALSDDDISGYLSGSGMGFAKAAELNHYPGPRHVLELAEELHLSDDQQALVDSSFRVMSAKAVDLGTRLVHDERKLDSLFAQNAATRDAVEAIVRSIGNLRAELRNTHLQAHLDIKPVLTDEQIQAYDDLRGYGVSDHEHSGHSM